MIYIYINYKIYKENRYTHVCMLSVLHLLPSPVLRPKARSATRGAASDETLRQRTELAEALNPEAPIFLK